VVPFKTGVSALGPAQHDSLEVVLRDVREALRTAVTTGAVCLEVMGHADRTGTAERNTDLSRARAFAVVAYLRAEGVDPEELRPVGAGAWDMPGQIARSVTFHLDVTETIEPGRPGPGCRGAL
jgi:outer membrane protein OmpA-like peptidoglycan-associated protein